MSDTQQLTELTLRLTELTLQPTELTLRPTELERAPAVLVGDVVRLIFANIIGECSPYTLAAVCRIWRNEALGLSAMWDSMTIPARYVGDEAWLELADALLQRSGSVPLDISLPWYNKVGRRQTKECLLLLQMISKEASRWRSVRLELPEHATSFWLSIFDNPTPMLQELVVRMHPSFEKPSAYDDRTVALPRVPLLNQLSITHAPSLVLIIGGLTHLELSKSVPGYLIWRLLEVNARTLEHLAIALASPPSPRDFPWAQLRFGVLLSLCCGGYATELFEYNVRVSLPRVQELELRMCARGCGRVLVTDLRDQLTSIIYSPERESIQWLDACVLRPAHALRSLYLTADVDFEFLHECHDAWPLLERLTICGWRTMRTDAADMLCALLHARGVEEFMLELISPSRWVPVGIFDVYRLADRILAHSPDGHSSQYNIHVVFPRGA
ncbi:hypothetical protein AURDEDRAFT_166070 [Auricularia subglabra TFB-10046 SS5]|nr:hypothetical protein AURDEDRAFT_166070 [Auricularia subglabra TFB-10046 SS5]